MLKNKEAISSNISYMRVCREVDKEEEAGFVKLFILHEYLIVSPFHYKELLAVLR